MLTRRGMMIGVSVAPALAIIPRRANEVQDVRLRFRELGLMTVDEIRSREGLTPIKEI